jgi:phosphatidylinositol alpha-1,6-mannosyltransferase
MTNVGGMQRVATELHAALGERDDVAMRTIALRSSWRWVHVKAVPFLVSLAARLRIEAAWFRADAILFTSMTTALPLLLAGPALKKRGIRLAAIVHGLDVTDPNPAYQLAVRRLCRILDVVMPVSRATGDELVARGLAPYKVRVVPNAVDLGRFDGVSERHTDADATAVEGAHALADDAFLIITVGRQVRRKGFAWFVDDVMPKLPDRVVFWLAGDGPERPEIESAIERQQLGARVRCLGRVSEDELVELYRRADLFIMPNIVVPGDMEGFGIVMLEAGACGLPTLAADLEGIRDVISEGVNGWFAPTGDAEAFASRIQTLLDDRNALAEASRRTADHVKNTFTWDKTAERYLEALRDPG